MKSAFWVMFFWLIMLPVRAQRQDSQQTPDKTNRSRSPESVTAQTPAPLPTAAASPASAPPAATLSADENGAADSALRMQIQGAFDRDPVFSRAGVKVTASADGIELSGDVASGRDRLNAARIAQSYARGKKVVNHIAVKGHIPPSGANAPENPPANFSGSADRSSNVSPP